VRYSERQVLRVPPSGGLFVSLTLTPAGFRFRKANYPPEGGTLNA